jgi:hypothetical protein
MLNDLLIWAALLVGLAILVVDKRRGCGALTLAYFLALSVGHVPGLLAYLDPETIPAGAEEPTKIGFDVTLIGMTTFVVGAIAARILPQRTVSVEAYQAKATVYFFSRIGRRVLTIGLVAYFVVLPISALVPSTTAVTSALGTLLVLGFWLLLYASVGEGRSTLIVLGFVPLLPMATLATGGFIGYGTVWALSVVAFAFAISRRRIWFFLATPVFVFIGLSLFVTYFQQREDIRQVVWDESTSIIQRLTKVSSLVTDFQPLDLSNDRHLFALDQRLNQNYLVGRGVMRHRAGDIELWYGATVPAWALIPRAIWPDKPAVGGGRNVVSEFTGIFFEEGTSVGIGQVLEFYVNFGMPGVVAGFGFLGFILMRLDQGTMRAFARRDVNGIMQRVLPALALVNPLGNLLEILVAVASAIVTSYVLARSKLLGSPPIRKLSAKMRVVERQ